MRLTGSRLALAASFTLIASGIALSQQITYYDFNGPQGDPTQVSRQCASNSAPGNALFCFNDGTGAQASPSFISDTYPAIIDPVTTDNPPVSSTNQAVQMTPPQELQASSMWFSVPQQVANGFTAYFAFKMTPNPNSFATADGIAFVIQNSSGGGQVGTCAATGAGLSIVGGNGGCIGYGGIDNSVAIELDTYRNTWDPDDEGTSDNDNHVAIMNCGAGLPNSPDHTGSCQVNFNLNGVLQQALNSQPGVTLADGNVHQVVINYSGPNEATPNLLQIFIDPAFNPGTHTPVTGSIPVLSGIYNIAANVNLLNSGSANDSAYIGFTSATGAAFEQHEILAWTYTPHSAVTQVQPLNPPGQPTTFPFGTHVYAVTYPVGGPSTTGINMVITANAVPPLLFTQLIANTPFAGSQCQVYDDTGGNCIIYSVSCVVAATNAVTECPATDPTLPILIKSAYNNSTPAITPGFLQGDPFFSQVATISGGNQVATVTCTGECSVTTGQTITIVGSSIAGFNGTVTVLSADPAVPNAFTFATSTTGNATGGYLTSNNVQNVFVSYSPQRIDATTSGKIHSFSDFVVTSLTAAPTTLSLQAPSASYGTPATVTVTASSGNGVPPGDVLLSVDNGAPLSQPLAPNSTGGSVATFTLSGLTGGMHSLTATYTTNGVFLGNTATGSINITQASSSISIVSDTPNPSPIQSPVALAFTVNGSGTPTGTYSVSSSVNGDPGCSGTLAAGAGTCLLTFQTPGARTLTISYSGDNNFAPTSTMVQQTVSGSPIAKLSATSLNFGTLYLGGIGEQSVTLTNVGTLPMTVNLPFIFDVGNGDSKEFIALSLCPGSLGVNKSCTIYVVFLAGPSYNTQTAILKIVDNAPGSPQTVNLTANVINPQATFTPSKLTFASQKVGTTAQTTVQLTNSGNTSLTLSGMSLQGSNSGDFGYSPNCPASLNAGASCTISISFTPKATGNRSANLNVLTNTRSGSQQLPLSGTGK
jgi:hypothetical protein